MDMHVFACVYEKEREKKMGRGWEPKEKEEGQFGNLHTPVIVEQWKKPEMQLFMVKENIYMGAYWPRLTEWTPTCELT